MVDVNENRALVAGVKVTEVTTTDMTAIKDTLDQEEIEEMTLSGIIAEIGLADTVRKVQHLHDHGIIPRLFRAFRHNYLSTNVLTSSCLAVIFETATISQLVSILNALNLDTLQYLNERIVDDANGLVTANTASILVKIMLLMDAPSAQIGSKSGILIRSGFYRTLCTAVALISSPSGLQAGAAAAIEQCLCEDSEEMTVDIMKEIITALTQCVKFAEPLSLRVSIDALNAILNVSGLVQRLNLLEYFGETVEILRNVVDTLGWENEGEMEKVLKRVPAFYIGLTQYGEVGVDILVEKKIVSTLLNQLNDNNEKIKTPTSILIFSMFHKGTEDHMQAVLDGGYLEKVPLLLSQGSPDMAKHYTMSALSTILRTGTEDQFNRVVDPGFLPSYLPTAVELFTKGNEEVKLESGILLVDLWKNALRYEITVDRFAEFGLTLEIKEKAEAYRSSMQTRVLFRRFAQAFGNLQLGRGTQNNAQQQQESDEEGDSN